LLDASSEFLPYFDKKIAEVRAKLNPQDLGDFKTVMQIVFRLGHPRSPVSSSAKRESKSVGKSFGLTFNSGREQEAWRSLADMWPAADVDRIRAALVSARARGIRSQVDGVSTRFARAEKRAKIFDATTS